MVAQQPDPVGDLVVVGHDRAGVAEGTEVLARIEAEAADVGETVPARRPPRRAPVGLRGVLDDHEAVAVGEAP